VLSFICELECDQLFNLNKEYIYIQRESDYDALQSIEHLCVLRYIFNFKLEIIDPNRSI
jgi:hypothetical protein